MWKQTIPTTMQGFGDYCKNMVQDNGSNGNSISITLRDTRDNNTYTVAKLKDGKCWMTQNLRIVDTTLEPEDSDVASSFILPKSNSAWKFSDNTDNAFLYLADPNQGTFYSWYTATVHEGTRAAADNQSTAQHSICPKGWKLPSRQDAEAIVSVYDNSTARRSPANFYTIGYLYNDTPYTQAGGGWYWTATGYKGSNTNHGWATEINLRNAFNIIGDHSPYGAVIRCIAR